MHFIHNGKVNKDYKARTINQKYSQSIAVGLMDKRITSRNVVVLVKQVLCKQNFS